MILSHRRAAARKTTTARTRVLHGLGVLVLAAACLVRPAAAQEHTDGSTDGMAHFSSDTKLVVLHASVVDRRGNLITDLPADAFTVYENDEPQKITRFGREDVPVSMGLIIDSSGSMQDKRAQVESAAMTLVNSANKQDEGFVVNFNDVGYLDAPCTADHDRLQRGLTNINSRGQTAMRDAVSMSIDYALDSCNREKKVLFVVTDGEDSFSDTTLEELVKKAQQSEVLVYAIGLISQEQRRERQRAMRELDALTEASGGLAYYPNDTSEVAAICAQVAHEIRNQYVIVYSPTNQELDGTYRRIRVEIKGHGRVQVRTRTGYYAVDRLPATSAPPMQSPKN